MYVHMEACHIILKNTMVLLPVLLEVGTYFHSFTLCSNCWSIPGYHVKLLGGIPIHSDYIWMALVKPL